jgi:DNA end-binding protein Ku
VEYEPGRYVTLTADELARAGAEDSKTIDIKQFSNQQDISPSFYEKPYFIVPDKGGERAYSLMREALQGSRKLAISQFRAYGREHIGAISGYGDLLILYQLRFASELVPRSQIKTPSIPKASPREIEALKEVIERFSGPFYINDFRDEQTDKINRLVERKIKGLPVPKDRTPAPQTTAEEDFLPVLRSTLAGAGVSISATTGKTHQSKSNAKGVKSAATRSKARR